MVLNVYHLDLKFSVFWMTSEHWIEMAELNLGFVTIASVI